MDLNRQALDMIIDFLNKTILTTCYERDFDSLQSQLEYMVFITGFVDNDNFSVLLQYHSELMVGETQINKI